MKKVKDKKRAKLILILLRRAYSNAQIALKYTNVWELLVAVILSAQSTDVQINKITKKLFKKYKTIQDYAQADISEFEQDIKSSGFYRNKAKHILETAKIVQDKYNGKVPDTMEKLIQLPGVARKTANIVLTVGFGIIEGIAVDTHVKRVSFRLGFTKNTNPDKIEKDLMYLFDKSDWPKVSLLFILHGRNICQAKKPKCDACILAKYCPSAFKFPHFKK